MELKNLRLPLLLASFLLVAALGLCLFAGHAAAAVSITESAYSPTNASTGEETCPVLSVTVSVTNSPHVTIVWATNETGSWVIHATMTNVHNGTHTVNATWLSGHSTTYYWRVGYWYSGGNHIHVYHFATESVNTHMSSEMSGLSTTIITLMIAVIPIILIISVFAMIMKKIRFK